MSRPDYANCVALVGMAGRFPGARDVEALWQSVVAGTVAITRFTDEQVLDSIRADDSGSIPHRLQELKSGNWVPVGYVADDVDKFDAAFFGYTPAEAELLDPQQRMFLETVWAAVEDAGYVPDAYPGVVGVYAGAGLSRYFLKNVYSHRDIVYSPRDLTAGIGNEPDYVTNRAAYKLDLRGPAVTVQTACSTSLVAIHQACQSLISGETDLCLAGGVLVNVPGGGYLYREGSMNSPDGLVRSFDAGAEGTVFADAGVGVVCLKRMEDALAQGDQIYAVILGSAVGNDGSHKAGYTAPGVEGQVKVVQEALSMAGISPESIGYMESHGTGTPLGDPIEITALTQAWQRHTSKVGFCALGSIKPNVGHLATVAGVASLIKAAFVTQRGKIPKLANFSRPNPRIEFERTPFHIPTETSDWPAQSMPRRAAVSSFGIGGTNAHVILEQPPEPAPRSGAVGPFLLPVSARTAAALDRQLSNLSSWLSANPGADLRDVAFTLQRGRKPFEFRAAVVGGSPAELAEVSGGLRGRRHTKALPAATKVVWMFSGQGAQYVEMARGLYGSHAAYTAALDECLALLSDELDLRLRETLLPGAGVDRLEVSKRLSQTAVAQPALFAVEYALAMQLRAFGFEPDLLVGHSLGEYVAACLAGTFDLRSALRLVALRGRLMQSMPAGSMLSVGLEWDELARYVSPDLSLAADNAPATCVVSGSTPAVEALKARLEAAGHFARLLVTSHAFHSPMMEPIVQEFAEAIRAAAPKPPARAWISNLTGESICAEDAVSPAYWAKHLLGTVRFRKGIEALSAQGAGIFVEVGPGNTLATFARRTLADRAERIAIAETVRHPRIDAGDDAVLLGAVGRLHAAGVAVNWDNVCSYESARRVSLPTYAFERERHWLEPAEESHARASMGSRLEVADWYSVSSWCRGRRWQGLAATNDLSGRVVLVVGAGDESIDGVALQIQRAGAKVVRWLPKGRSAPAGIPAEYLDLGSIEELERAFERLVANDAAPERLVVIDASGLAASADAETKTIELGLERRFYDLLWLIQALANASLPRPPILLTLVSGVAQVLRDDRVNPAQALSVGVHLCLGHEKADWQTAVLDLGLDDLGVRERDALGAAVVYEIERLSAAQGPEIGFPDKVVAYRQGFRFTPACEPARLPESRAFSVREGGVYLITGGLGGLGLEMGEWLARGGAGTVVLLSRFAFPARDAFEARLVARGHEDETARRIQKILTIEARGAEVVVLQADVADASRLSELIAEVRTRFGALHGVIHAAGVAGGGVLELKTREQAHAVLSPKVLGTHALCTALRGVPLDFVALFSSIFGYVGGRGQIDYSAGNAFLDAYAPHARVELGLPVISIGWGPFSEVGMAARRGRPAEAARREGRAVSAIHPLLQREITRDERLVEYGAWLRPRDCWFLSEHVVAGHPTVPGTALLEMARAAFEALTGQRSCKLADVLFVRPFFVTSEDGAEARIVLQALDARNHHWEIFALGDAGQRQLIASGLLARHEEGTRPARAELGAARVDCSSAPVRYEDGKLPVIQDSSFLQLGAHWHVVRELRFGRDSMLAELSLSAPTSADAAVFGLHPSLLDMATGPITGYLLSRLELGLTGEYLPYRYGTLDLYRDLPGEGSSAVVSHVRFNRLEEDGDVVSFDIDVATTAGDLVVRISDFALRSVKGVSTAAVAKVRKAPAPSQLDDTISPFEGTTAMARTLGALSEPHFLVTPVSLPEMLADIKERVRSERRAEGDGRKRQQRDGATVVPPENDIQRTLVQVFERILGIEPVGIRDNFFELGGDSVIGIQIVSECNGQGLSFKPGQLFERQTIEELSAVVATTAAWKGGAVGGDTLELPMTAGQRLRNVGFSAETAQLGLIHLSSPLPHAEAETRVAEVLRQMPMLRLRAGEQGVWTEGREPDPRLWPVSNVPLPIRDRLAEEAPFADVCVARLCGSQERVTSVVLALHPALAADAAFWQKLALALRSDSVGASRPPTARLMTGYAARSEPPASVAASEAQPREFVRRELRYDGGLRVGVRKCFEEYNVTTGEILVCALLELDGMRWPACYETVVRGHDQAGEYYWPRSLLLDGSFGLQGPTGAARLLEVKRHVRRLMAADDRDAGAPKLAHTERSPRVSISDFGRVSEASDGFEWSGANLIPAASVPSLGVYGIGDELRIEMCADASAIEALGAALDHALRTLLTSIANATEAKHDFIAAEFQDAGLSSEDLASILGTTDS